MEKEEEKLVNKAFEIKPFETGMQEGYPHGHKNLTFN